MNRPLHHLRKLIPAAILAALLGFHPDRVNKTTLKVGDLSVDRPAPVPIDSRSAAEFTKASESTGEDGPTVAPDPDGSAPVTIEPLGWSFDLPYNFPEMLQDPHVAEVRKKNTPAPGRRIVTTVPGFDPTPLKRLGKVVHLGGSRAWLVHSENESALLKVKGVLAAEPDWPIWVTETTPNDANFNLLWGMKNTAQFSGAVAGMDSNATFAWDTQTGSSSVIVAVLDTGVDRTHPDLDDNMWVNTAELNGQAGVDDDGNGKIDDVNGWDFVSNDNDPIDVHSHGTHCAGTIGAEGNNGIGVAGVCWNVKIMACQVLGDDGIGYASYSTAAIYYAVDNGAKVLSNSYGGSGYSAARDTAIGYADTNGVLFIAAAGNDGTDNDTTPHWPSNSSRPNVISVANMDVSGGRTSSSNFGDETVDMFAPGRWIYSTMPGGSYAYKTGTSMACPHVAGAAALYLSQYPTATHMEVLDAIKDSLEIDAAYSGVVRWGGRLNLSGMLAITPPSASDADAVRIIAETGNVGSNPRLTVHSGAVAVAYADTTNSQTDLWSDRGLGGGTLGDRTAQSGEFVDGLVSESVLSLFSSSSRIGAAIDGASALDFWLDDGSGAGTAGDHVVGGTERRTIDASSPSMASLFDNLGQAVLAFSRDSTGGVHVWIDDGAGGGSAGDGSASGSEIRTLAADTPTSLCVARYAGALCVSWTTGTSVRFWIDDGLSGGTAGNGIADGGEIRTHALASPQGVLLDQLGNQIAGAWLNGSGVLQVWVDDGTGGGTASDRIVDSGEVRTVAGVTASEFDLATINNKIAVAYRDSGNTLKVWIDDGTDSGSPADVSAHADEIRSIDNGSGVGYGIRMASFSGRLIMLYRDETNDDLKLAELAVTNSSPSANAGADIVAEDVDGDGSQGFLLDGSSSSDPDGSITQYKWTLQGQDYFGQTLAANLPIGVYVATLTVYDDGNPALTDTDTVTITVQADSTPNQAPVANAGIDIIVVDIDNSGDQGAVLTGTSSSDPDGSIIRYEWSVGGSLIGVGPQIAGSFPVGVTEVTLTVFDDGAPQKSATDTVNVTVNGPGAGNQAPTAVAGADVNIEDTDNDGAQGFIVNASGSSDPDGAISRYEWRVGGSLVAIGQVAAIRLDVGNHTVELTVRDNGIPEMIDTDTLSVTITTPSSPNQAPTAAAGSDITVYDTDDNGSQGFVVQDAGSSDPDGSITRYEWEFGGSVVAVGSTAAISLPTGNHVLTLRVFDDGTPKLTATDTVNVSVVAYGALPNQAPTAVAGSDFIIEDGDGDGEQGFVLNGSGSSDPDGSIVYSEWRLGSGGPIVAKGLAAALRYPVGTYTFELYVRDDGSPTLTATDTIEVTIDPQGGGSSVEGGFDIDPPEGPGGDSVASDDDAPPGHQVDAGPEVVGVAPYSAAVTDRSKSLDGTGLLSWEYDFDNDGVWDASSPEDGDLLHVFRRPGIHTVRQRVTDEKGRASITTRTVEILAPADPPVITGITVQTRTADGATLLLTPSVAGSHGIDKVLWDFNEDGRFDAEAEGNGAVEHMFLAPGENVVTGVLLDSRGVESQPFRKTIVVAHSGHVVRIVDPAHGSTVGGSSLLVRATVVPAGALNIEYRVKGATVWNLVPVVRSTGGDVESSLDLSSLALGTDLEFRAVTQAVDSNGDAFTSPVVEFKRVADGQADVSEERTSDGRVVRTANGSTSSEFTAVASNGLSLTVPIGAIDGSAVTVRLEELAGARHPQTSGSVHDEGLASAATHVAVDLSSGGDDIHIPGSPLQLVIPYDDADDDGIVDGTGVPEGELSVHWYDEELHRWRRVPDAVIDIEANVVRARIVHLTDYGLFSGSLGKVSSGVLPAGGGSGGACLLRRQGGDSLALGWSALVLSCAAMIAFLAGLVQTKNNS